MRTAPDRKLLTAENRENRDLSIGFQTSGHLSQEDGQHDDRPDRVDLQERQPARLHIQRADVVVEIQVLEKGQRDKFLRVAGGRQSLEDVHFGNSDQEKDRKFKLPLWRERFGSGRR